MSTSLKNTASKSPAVSELRGWIMWGMVAFFYFYQFVVRASPGVMSVELMKAFSVSAAALGTLTGVYYLVYAPLQLPLGVLMDRFGPRRMATMAILLCASGCLVFASATSLSAAQFGRMLMGAGSACAFLSCVKIATEWLPPHRLALAIGLTMCIGTLGGTSAGRPLATAVDALGWQSTLWVIATVGLALAMLVWVIVRDRPGHVVSESQAPSVGLLQGLFEITRQRQSWYIALYALMMYVPLAVFGDTWGVPYLMQRYTVDSITASTPASMMYLGLVIGAPIFAYLPNLLKSYRLPMGLSSGITCAIFTFIFFWPGELPLSVMYPLLLLSGIALGGQFLAFAIICESNRPAVSGTATGFTNMVCMVSGILFSPLVGKVLDHFWDGALSADAVRQYSTDSFHSALIVIPIASAIGLGLVMTIRDSYGRAAAPSRRLAPKRKAR